MKQRVTRQSGRKFGTGVTAAAVLVLGACSDSGNSDGQDGGSNQTSTEPPAQVSLHPTAGQTGVEPRDDVEVSVANGKIASVTLTNEQGQKVEGELAADGSTWEVTEPLGYGKTYTWSGNATNDADNKTPINGRFTTVQPESTVHAQSNVGDDRTYGVAMPIALSFDQAIKNKAAVEKALSVETSKDIEGSWAWLDGDTSVHWRPKDYWKPQTDVHVEAMLYGVHMGDGAYGEADLTVDFSIGEKQVIKGDTQSHRLQLYRDGEQVGDYPVSYGANSDPRRITRSGTHVVMAEHETFSMSNAQFGYENVEVPWAIRISNNGEFIHGYAETIDVQGERNVSHGCINMAPQDAHEVANFAQLGDPVEITGSNKQLGAHSGAYYDWTYSWQEWQSFSALNE